MMPQKKKALLNRVLHSLVSAAQVSYETKVDAIFFVISTYHYQKMVNMQRATIALWPDKRGRLLSTKGA